MSSSLLHSLIFSFSLASLLLMCVCLLGAREKTGCHSLVFEWKREREESWAQTETNTHVCHSVNACEAVKCLSFARFFSWSVSSLTHGVNFQFTAGQKGSSKRTQRSWVGEDWAKEMFARQSFRRRKGIRSHDVDQWFLSCPWFLFYQDGKKQQFLVRLSK